MNLTGTKVEKHTIEVDDKDVFDSIQLRITQHLTSTAPSVWAYDSFHLNDFNNLVGVQSMHGRGNDIETVLKDKKFAPLHEWLKLREILTESKS